MADDPAGGADDPGVAAVRAFAAQFGGRPDIVARAPGRVNLIGDHTDYNEGFVLPMAIDRATWIAARPRDDGRVVVHSLDFGETASFALDDEARGNDGWVQYLRGMGWALREAGYRLRTGWEGVSVGNVPVGAGLSSSASLELATARVFARLSGLDWNATEMAKLAQRAENAWVGVNCGIMDQLISSAGVAGHALLIDCRSLETRPVPLPASAAVVVLDTATRRGLVDSAYNERRAQCETAAAAFGARTLRDVTLQQLDAATDRLDPVTRRRARHVISESVRTRAAADALAAGALPLMGRLMNESHASLRDDFEVSRLELDVIVSLAQGHPDCLGARMTGAGFGGCAVALVHRDGAARFAAEVARDYEAGTGLRPAVYVCAPAGGASVTSVGG
ncbi:MAG: Galactokinase [Gemmatimonadetes bacterium]|jgi:galactokinase|nr:Galactokinase [Gemmatimonadota bacterium]